MTEPIKPVTPLVSPVEPLSDEEVTNLIEQHNKGGAFAKQINESQSCWDAGIVVRKGCSHMNKPTYQIHFTNIADEKIKRLQGYYPSLEWLMYLEGSVDHESQSIVVEDLVIPDKQYVTGVNVNSVEYTWAEGRDIIGVIHSHHSMGAFFSGTDDAYINQNHDVSIVVSTSPRSPILGQVRLKAPCDDYVLCEGPNVIFNYPVKVEDSLEKVMEEFEQEFSSKIHTFTYQQFSFGIGRGIRSMGSNMVNSLIGNQNPETGYYDPNDPYDGFVFEDEDPPIQESSGMTDVEISNELLKYYSAEEVSDFMRTGEGENELLIINQLLKEDIQVFEVFEVTEEDDDVVWVDQDGNVEEDPPVEPPTLH